MRLRTNVAMLAGAQPAPGALTLGIKRLSVGIPEVVDAMGAMVSSEVRAHADATYRLVETVGRLTDRLERETDTALLAIAGWTNMPAMQRLRRPLPPI